MDEGHLIAGVRYVALNPVRARLTCRAEDWKWSSLHAHLEGKNDGLAIVKRVLDRVPDFAALLSDGRRRTSFAALRSAEHTGRPLGNKDFIEGLERILGRSIARRALGRRPKQPAIEQPKLL